MCNITSVISQKQKRRVKMFFTNTITIKKVLVRLATREEVMYCVQICKYFIRTKIRIIHNLIRALKVKQEIK